MGLSNWFEIATDALFRELSNFATPPRAGRITAIEMNGQVRVDCDDPDGGDVLAWPLDGFTYAVNDVVYVAFAVNNPDSAIVLGSKSGEPSGGPYIRKDGTVALTGEWDIGEDRAIAAERLAARDAEGLRLEDDGGNLGVFIEDGGQVGIGGNATTPDNLLELWASAVSSSLGITRDSTAFSATIEMDTNRSPSATDPRYFFGLRDTTKYFTFGRWNGSSVGEDLVISVEGYVGIGRNAPQGKLHVHDGTAGMGLFTKTGVNATPQTILPNGAGDVVRAVYGSVLATDGTNNATPSVMTLRQGGTTTFDITAGTTTWRTTLNADGSLTVARTAGTGTGTLSYDLHWM